MTTNGKADHPDHERPIAPEVQRLLDRGRASKELKETICARLDAEVSALVAAHPNHKELIASVLEGLSNSLRREIEEQKRKDRQRGR